MIDGVTVVVCTYNGESRLAETLSCCVKQQATCEWELLVIDNASKDNTSAFCEDFLHHHGCAISWRVIYEQQPGLNFARLRGLRESKHDTVLFCDDDNGLDKNYVQIGFDLLNRYDRIGALGGYGQPVFEGEKPAWFDTYAHSFAVGPQANANGKLHETPSEVYGAGCFYRKAPLLSFFDKGNKAIMTDRIGKSLASGGDVEWCYIVQIFGFEVWYDSRLQFTHLMPAGRMQWSYYLRLKAGIASGSARLLPYKALLQHPNLSLSAYLVKWFGQFAFNNLAYYRLKIKYALRAGNRLPKEEIALVRLREKSIAFRRDTLVALRHFKQLKSVFLTR